MAEHTPDTRHHLGISVAWSYLFALMLLLFIFLILVPDADGPSPWDGRAFRAGVLEVAANFRVLDDLADLGLVRVADVGEGWLNADLGLIVVSDRRFGWTPFYLALVLVTASLLLRGLRQRLLARDASGVTGRGQLSGYFFGRGLNLFFPFGPGEMGTAQALAASGMSEEQATTAVFNSRAFELLALMLLLLAGFVYLGWEGAVLPACWGVLLTIAVLSLARPLGGAARGRATPLVHLWNVVNGPELVGALRHLLRAPGLLAGLSALSIATLGVEILGYWCLKQAFSSPMDDYVLMKDIAFVDFAIVILVANLTRVLPYTFASLGIYEIVSVAMFHAFGESFLAGASVSLLDACLINGVSAVAFAAVIWLGRAPSALDTWRTFVERSVTVADAHEEQAGDGLPSRA